MDIFFFCGRGSEFDYSPAWWWKNLIDVCRRWREIIFASPRFLDLRLECTARTATRKSLDIWPPFPIAVLSDRYDWVIYDKSQDNIIAALKHHDRVIQIDIEGSRLEPYFAVTRKPFPVLTDLELTSYDQMALVLDEEFLGGSTPRLQRFSLCKIAFPTFPKLALSGNCLSSLSLSRIPIAGYISPEAMATCLATLPSLERLDIGFESPRSRPDRIGLPPPTRAVLPTLGHFEFKGVSEYLEDLVARIDAPKLGSIRIQLFMDLLFNIPQLSKFIVRAEGTKSLNSAEIVFFSSAIQITFEYVIKLEIICREPDWQASSMAQVCSQLSPLHSHVKWLYIREGTPGQAQQGNGINPTQFLELFDLFPAMQSLCISGELRPLVARALQDLTGDIATEVLPFLYRLVFRGPSPSGSIQKDIQKFITARQDSIHPVDVEWEE